MCALGCLFFVVKMHSIPCLNTKKVEESDGNDSDDSDEDFFDCRETLSLRSRTASIPSVESDGGKVWLTYPSFLILSFWSDFYL